MLIKKLLAVALGLMAATCMAAVDINKASQAELESVKGIGPAMSTKILDERKKAAFRDWADVTERVKGVKRATATKFSVGWLTVNGASYETALAPAGAGPAGAATTTAAADPALKTSKKK